MDQIILIYSVYCVFTTGNFPAYLVKTFDVLLVHLHRCSTP